MKTIAIIFSIFICASVVSAHSADSLLKPTSQKNEIGFILNPAGIVLLGAEPQGQRIGISYKRNYKQSDIFLSSGVYYQGYNNNYNRSNELTLEVNGLLRNVQFKRETANKLILGFGVEKRKVISECPKVVSYFGVEAQLAYAEQNTNVGNQWMKADSNNIMFESSINLQPAGDFIPTNNITKTTIGGGFQLNAGFQLHLNKRIYLFAQAAPSFHISSTSRKENDYISNTSTTFNSSQFDFEMRALVSDIGLFIKF